MSGGQKTLLILGVPPSDITSDEVNRAEMNIIHQVHPDPTFVTVIRCEEPAQLSSKLLPHQKVHCIVVYSPEDSYIPFTDDDIRQYVVGGKTLICTMVGVELRVGLA